MPTALATVIALNRYPVKSMQGEAADRLEFDDRGVVGDRRWGVVDVETGKVLSAKRVARLLEAGARTGARGRPVVTLPDGGEHEAGDPATDAALSAWLDRDVHLAPADEHQHRGYEMNLDATDDDSPVVEFPCPTGTFLDAAAVHLLTTASLAAAARKYPSGQWDRHRFRPTALLDAPGEGFVEDDWIGATVRFGTAELVIFAPTVRCALTTRPQPANGLSADREIARTLSREHGSSFGVYCALRATGSVACGDDIAPLDR